MDEELIEVYLNDDEHTAKFMALTTQSKAEVIALGLLAREVSQVKLLKMKDEDWGKVLDARVAEKEDELSNLQRCLELGNKSHELLVKELGNHTKQLIDAAVAAEKHNCHQMIVSLEERNQVLMKRVARMEEAQDSKLDRAVKTSTSILNEEIRRLTERLDQEMARGRTNQTLNDKSTNKGKCGEVYVQGELNKLFPTGEIEDTHSEAHRGDFIVRNDGLTMMVEAKNYKRNVQKGEIDKFYRDVDNRLNSEYDCALLVSLSSGVCNREDFCLEVRNGIPIMFIHNVAANFEGVKLAFKLFKVLKGASGVDLGSRELLDTFRNTANTLRRLMIRQKAALDKSYASQLDAISKQTELLETLFAATKVSF